MRIGIIGAGGLGGIVARRLARLGHQVSIANSRGPASLTAFAAEIGATPASVNDVAITTQLVIVSIPSMAITKLPPGLFANVPDTAEQGT